MYVGLWVGSVRQLLPTTSSAVSWGQRGSGDAERSLCVTCPEDPLGLVAPLPVLCALSLRAASPVTLNSYFSLPELVWEERTAEWGPDSHHSHKFPISDPAWVVQSQSPRAVVQ